MDRRTFLAGAAVLAASRLLPGAAQAQGAAQALPAPRTDGGMPLMKALAERRSSRSFAPRELGSQELSDILWAAFGVNRADGRRTAPSARNFQEIDVYAVVAGGAYLYNAQGHSLVPVAEEDIRGLTGSQAFAASAPLNLVYVADYERIGAAESEKERYAAWDTGFISQNVYLVCATLGLATVVRASMDRPRLAAALGLAPRQRITLAQSIGHPG